MDIMKGVNMADSIRGDSINVMPDNFCRTLKLLRKKNKLSCTKLACLAQISPSYLSRIERMERKNPGISVMQRLLKVLNTNYEEIIGVKPSQKHDELSDFEELMVLNDFTIQNKKVTDEEKEQI